MSVQSAAEGGFTIVQMHGFEVLEADCFLEAGERGFERGARAQVVPRGEDVACVYADSDAGFVVNQRDYRS